MTQEPQSGQASSGLSRELGLVDATMIVAGSMIGSGIFIVSADMARVLGSPGWLLVAWLVTGALTLAAALSYGELAALAPQAGGQYVYLREAWSKLAGFSYGWTLFLVIQTGTIAAVCVGFARFLGVLWPAVAPDAYLVAPIHLSKDYALSLSTQQLVAIVLIALLTWSNTRGVHLGKLVQNTMTSAKTVALVALILLGLAVGLGSDAMSANFRDAFTSAPGTDTIRSDLPFMPQTGASDGALGLLVALCVAMVGSIFSADAWNNVTFAAGEVRQPERTVPLSLTFGTFAVTGLYLLANVAYLLLLPVEGVAHAPDDRVATAALGVVFGPAGAAIMAVAIIVSTFGCANGLIFAGARVYYAMAKDGVFFKAAARLNAKRVPAVGLVMQGVWAALLVLPRTRLGTVAAPDGALVERYGNLYGNLLDYVVFAVLLFYVLTIGGVFVLRRRRPDAPRPYRVWGYPWLPASYVVAASVIMAVLALYRTQTTWPGLLIAASGVPVYYLWRGRDARAD